MKTLIQAASTAALLFLLGGCQATNVEPTAQRVRIMQSEPHGCRYLGEVTGNQGNFFTGGWTSNSNLETGARNDLKNQASHMGGNAMVLITNRAGQTASGNWYSSHSQQTNVTLSATVFRCPVSAMR